MKDDPGVLVSEVLGRAGVPGVVRVRVGVGVRVRVRVRVMVRVRVKVKVRVGLAVLEKA